MLDDYLKRKGLVITDPWVKNRILVHLVSNIPKKKMKVTMNI